LQRRRSLRGLLVHGGAKSECGIGIDSAVAFLDKLDDALLVDDNVCAQSPLVRLVLDIVGFQNAIGLEHLAVHVAEQRKLDAYLLGESTVGGGTVHADAEDFRVGCVDSAVGDSSLDRLKLLGSTAGEGQNVHGKVDVFLAAKVAELDALPLVAEKGEIRSSITNL